MQETKAMESESIKYLDISDDSGGGSDDDDLSVPLFESKSNSQDDKVQ